MEKLWVGVFFLFFTFATTNLTFGCFEHEREALLLFKRSLESDDSGRISSWNGNDCCNWQGIGCDNATGYVTSLDLGAPWLYFGEGMELNVSLAELTRLTQLRFLNLSSMGFFGIIPHFIGNLSNLRVLDLSSMDLVVDDFTWFWSLLSLKHLDLSGVNIVTAPNLDKVLLCMISSLRVLRLSKCELSNSHFYRTHLEPNLTLSPIQTLDLSSNGLQGFPLFLQNLTALQVLDLSQNELNSTIPFMRNVLDLNLGENKFRRFQDIGVWRLCQLKRLDLSFNSMEGRFTGPTTNVSECAQFDLETLNLIYNKLGGEIPTSLGRLTALRELYLRENELTGNIPEALGNLTSLRELDLASNKLTGSIPTSIGNLLLLRDLDLSGNELTIQHNCSYVFPLSIGNLSELQSLDISYNLLQGSVPTIGGLSKLDYLDISNNYISGVLTEAHFANTSMITHLDASSNYKLSLKISPDWEPPFQITTLLLGSCKIESEFPRWLRTQKRLVVLHLSNTSIFGPLPDWLGELPLMVLDLSHNFLNGSLTNFQSNQTTLQIYPGPFTIRRSIRTLLLKNNHFSGPIPDSLCNVTELQLLDLSRNMLSGSLPECFGNFQELLVLILSSNRLSGVIPSSLGNIGSYLSWLSLNNNGFRGEFPKTLANCSRLSLLDLGENRFFGSVPKWIGENITYMNILRLHTNSFTGRVPLEWCKSDQLQILDVAENKLTGNIPRCFCNLSRMTAHSENFIPYPVNFEKSVSQVMKGVELEYTKTFIYVVSMDLSSNKLVGEIPKELVLLSGLLNLNLSNNHLTGRIPDRIGDMNSLMSLDLSSNDIFGMIPQSLSALTFLSHLNLSHNNLSGKIPSGSQLQTLIDPSIYAGNKDLCGSPLPIKCNHDEVPKTGKNDEEDEEDDGLEKMWIYGVTSGFTTGFMGIVGVLVLKNRWRLVLFNFVGYYIGKKL